MAALTDEDLERQAKEMAEKALPASLPAAVRSAKLPAVTEKILERLKKQRGEQTAKPAGAGPIAGQPGLGPSAAPGAPPPPTAPPPPGVPPPPPEDATTSVGVSAVQAEAVFKVPRVEGVELFGDEPWFADPAVRQRLRDSVIEAHREQKILVGQPADEIMRICPQNGRTLGAGGVLRLGGAHLGGYGESDIAYAYRQLARALHPDKNPHLSNAAAAFKRLSEAADELRQGLTEQRAGIQTLVALTGVQATPEMLERPQEALFAEACRVLCAVCAVSGEGSVPPISLSRAMASFTQSVAFQSCQPQALLNEWFQRSHLLDLYAGSALRTAYDCAPKRCRAQFLCLLNRALMVEATRNGDDCIRGGWSGILQSFPELALWRDFRERLQKHVWDSSGDGDEAEVYADEPKEPETPAAPVVPELDPKSKALKLLEYSWQACSGPDFQNAYDKLRKRGKVTLQMGIMQLMEQATAEAANRLNLGADWRFKNTVDLVKQHKGDITIRRKSIELERMLFQSPGKFFGLREESPDRSGGHRRDRSRSRRRSRSRSRRRRRRSRTRSRSRRRRSRSRSDRGQKRRRDDKKKEEEPAKEANGPKNGDANGTAAAKAEEKPKAVEGPRIPFYRKKWDQPLDPDAPQRRCAKWARRWRMALGTVLPSGLDSAAPMIDADVRKLAATLWNDVVVKWATGGEAERGLGLFRADVQTAQTFGWDGTTAVARGLDPEVPPCEWSFVPVADLLLVIGEGLTGLTAEGIFGDNPAGHRRFTLEEFYENVDKVPTGGPLKPGLQVDDKAEPGNQQKT